MQNSSKQFEQALDHLKDRIQSAEAYLDEKRQTMETYVDQTRTSVEEFVHNAKDSAGRILNEVQSSTEEGLRLVKERPLTVWMIVFMSGYLFGVYSSRKIASRNAAKQLDRDVDIAV